MSSSGKRCGLWVFALLVAALSFVACAPQIGDGGNVQGGEDGAPSVVVAWTPASDCGVCHAQQAGTLASIACSGVECMSCHVQEAELVKVHDGVATGDKLPKKLKKTSVEVDACGVCHGTLADVAAKTAESVAVMDMNGLVVNPHDLPVSDSHTTLVCGSCHKMHDEASVQESAMVECQNCHHMGVFECGTCHE